MPLILLRQSNVLHLHVKISKELHLWLWGTSKSLWSIVCSDYVPFGKLTGVHLQLWNEAIVCLVSEHARQQKKAKQLSSNLLSMQESSKKRPKEALIEEQSSTDIDSDPLHILATTKSSKVVGKKDLPEHQVYIHVHSTQDKIAFHLDHVI